MNPRKRPQPLTREELVDVALEIVDSKGLAALTMRRLAAALGVEAMSLYHYVPSKEVLLDWTVERMRSEMRIAEPLPDDWADALEAIFVEYRQVLTAHPNMLPLATRRTGRAATSGLQYLIDQGLPLDEAAGLYQALAAFTVGYSLLSSPLVENEWAGLPEELAQRVGDWRETTFRRALRAVMDDYRSERGEERR